MRAVKYALAALCLLLVVYNVGCHLSRQTILYTDESWYIASGIEMLKAHHFIVNTIWQHTDYRNTKPPLGLWGVMAGYSLPLPPLLAVRLFSLLAALATALATFLYGYRTRGFYVGLLAVLLLFTIPDFVTNHNARSADCDMLFIGMTTLGLLAFSRGRAKALATGYFFLGLAFLAKSFHALPYALAALAYTLYLVWIGRLSLRRSLLLPFCFYIPVLPWAVARYAHDGLQFFSAMVQVDLLDRRYAVGGTQAIHSFYYFNSIQLGFGLALIAAAIALIHPPARATLKSPTSILLLLWTAIPLSFLVSATNGFFWYVFPVFPAIALLIATPVVAAVQSEKRLYVVACSSLVLILLFSNEQRLQHWVSEVELDPLSVALTQIHQQTGGRAATVAIAGTPVPWSREYYATAVLYNLIPVNNLPAAAPDYLISSTNSVSRLH